MSLVVIALVAIGVWISMALLVISLCQVAQRSDEAMDSALAQAQPPRVDQTLRSLDLGHAAACAPRHSAPWAANIVS